MAGGPVFAVLVMAGCLSVFVFLARLAGLRRAQIDYGDFIRGVANVLSRGNVDEALALCDETPAPVARIVAAAIRHRDGSARVLRSVVDATGRAEVGRLERRLALLAIIAQAAPLMGLLGTVLGMMRLALALRGAAMVTRADMLGGALQCLTATAAGLVVAVAVQAMYGVLHVRLARVVSDMEAAASEILSLLSAKRETPAS
jgi:biopolymer transport protein ExbB